VREIASAIMAMSLAVRLSLLLVFMAIVDAAMPINAFHDDLSPPRGRPLRSPARGVDSDIPDRYPSPLPPRSRRFELAGSIVETGAAAPEPQPQAGGEARAQATLRSRSSSSARPTRDPSSEQLDLEDASDFSSIDV